jgi:hypothetical protein
VLSECLCAWCGLMKVFGCKNVIGNEKLLKLCFMCGVVFVVYCYRARVCVCEFVRENGCNKWSMDK